ncbi:MAG: YihY/virulence factor BrkB family protein [Thermodesulfobacteriota bacterium]
MIMKTATLENIASWIWAIPTEADRGLRNFFRGLLRVHVIVCKEFLKDNIPLRASALTFIVALSMVPVLALGTAVLKGLGKGDELRQSAHSFIVQLESTTNSQFTKTLIPLKTWDKQNDIALPPQPGRQLEDSLSSHLKKAVDFVFDYVDQTNFAALGAAGILFLLFAVFLVLHSIEQTMNGIWQTSTGRSPGRKILDYLAMMIILPLTINFGVAASAALHSDKLLSKLQLWLPWIGLHLLNLLPVFALVAAFTFFYSFLPHTKVRFSAALTGGIVGGISWLLIQALYFKLQIIAVNYNAIYGSFATLPLFLLWIHVSWMVFLTGAEVSFAVQIWRRYQRQKVTLTPIGRLSLTFEIISTIAANYQQKKITTRDSLVWTLKQPDAYIAELLDTLIAAKFLHYVGDSGGGYVPSAPPSELNTREIGDLIMGELPSPITEDNPAIKALASVRKSLSGQKIQSINLKTHS